MKDWLGGSIVAGGELTGVILLIVGLTYREDASTTSSGDGSWSSSGEVNGNLPAFFGGFALTVGSIVFGYVRPFSYDKSLAKKNGLAFNPENINIALGPNRGGMAVQMSYKMSF
jgi:hypothetical protein